MRGFVRHSIGAAVLLALAGTAAADAVEGTLTANGKATKMTYVTALPGDEVEAGGPAIAVVIGEKAPADGEVTLESAGEGEIGDFVIATINTETLRSRHNEMEHGGLEQVASVKYGSGGFLEAEGLKLDGGTLSGRLFTSEPYDFFDEIVAADLKFSVTAPK